MFFKKNTFKVNYIFVAVSIILFIGFGFSEAIISIGSGLILLHLFFNNNFTAAYKNFSTNKSLWMLLTIFIFYLIGSLVTKNKELAFSEINRNLFWILIPTGVALTPKLKPKDYWNLLFFFVVIITVATFTTSVNYFIKGYNFENFRAASLIRHSSLSIYTVFSVFILITGKLYGFGIVKKINIVPLIVWVAYLILFLSVQKSLLGIVALFSALIAFLLIQIHRMKNIRKKLAIKVLLIISILFPIFYIGIATFKFYNVEEEEPNRNLKTELGNFYSFDLNNKTKENGEYVYWYICEKELEDAWASRFNSNIYDNTSHGFTIYDIVIRYFTSKGLKKDASGVEALSVADYDNIMSGITNFIFVDMKYSFYPRIYQTIWELDVYFNSGDPNNKSLSQRIEYIKAAIIIIKENPFGIGVGNCKIEYEKAFDEIQSVLKPEFRIEAHNQYMSYTVKFGILGAIIIFMLILLPIHIERKKHNILLLIFLAVIGTVCIGDNLLELHSGLSFFVFFLSLFLWHSPEDITDVPQAMSN